MPILLRLAPAGALLTSLVALTSLLMAPAWAIPWQDAERITHNSLEDRTTSGSLANIFGGLTVVWMQEQPAPGWRIMWSDWLGDWTEPLPVDPSGLHPDYEPRIDDADGLSEARYLVWQRGSGDNAEIMYAQGDVGDLWAIDRITINATEDITPDIAYDNGPHVVWAGYDPISGTGKIFHAVPSPGGWQVERLAGSELGPFWTGAAPKVAVGSGIVHVVYRGGDFGNYHAHYARKENGVWTYQTLTSENGNDLVADVATDGGSNPVVAMSGNNGFGFPSRIYFRDSTNGGLTFRPNTLASGSFSASLANVTRGPYYGINIVGSEVSGNIYTGNLVVWTQWEAIADLLPPADQASEVPALDNSSSIFRPRSLDYLGVTSGTFTNHGGDGPDSAEVYVLSSAGGGQAVGDAPAPSVGLSLNVTPNPSRGGATITATSLGVAHSMLSIYDPMGRLVQSIQPAGDGTSAAATYRWDGRSASGTPVAGGVYFLRLDGTAPDAMTRLTIVR